MLNEQVRQIMTIDPVTVGPGNSIAEVTELMISNGLNQLPVVENGKLVGMITTHDLWKDSLNPEANHREISTIMSRKVIKIAPKDKVGTAAELFMDRRFKTLPVVNLNNELKGVVTAFDVMRLTLKKEYPTPILYKEVING